MLSDNIQEPITPSHLLTGRVMSLPDGPYNNELGEDTGTKVADITKSSKPSPGACLEEVEKRVHFGTSRIASLCKATT